MAFTGLTRQKQKAKMLAKMLLILSLSPLSMLLELGEYIKQPSMKPKCNIDSCLQFVRSVKFMAAWKYPAPPFYEGGFHKTYSLVMAFCRQLYVLLNRSHFHSKNL